MATNGKWPGTPPCWPIADGDVGQQRHDHADREPPEVRRTQRGQSCRRRRPAAGAASRTRRLRPRSDSSVRGLDPDEALQRAGASSPVTVAMPVAQLLEQRLRRLLARRRRQRQRLEERRRGSRAPTGRAIRAADATTGSAPTSAASDASSSARSMACSARRCRFRAEAMSMITGTAVGRRGCSTARSARCAMRGAVQSR